MRGILLLFVRFFIRQSQQSQNVSSIVLNMPIDDISFEIEIERYTVKHQCAIDSGKHIVRSNRDYDTFSDKGDTALWAEFLKYTRANKKAITKEENDRYRY